MRLPLVILIASTGLLPGDDAPLAAAEAHLRAHTVLRAEQPRPEDHRETIERLLQSRDPETTATSFLHGIRRHATKLLSEEQTARWNALLEEGLPQLKRWHDERNVLRGIFFARAWRLPALTPAEREPAMNNLRSWLRVWLELTLRERIAQHHLCRDAWALLTPAQRASLSRGDWDRFVRKSTGHQRAYFGDRIVVRALGPPNHREAFENLSSELERKQSTIRRNLLEAERRWRILTFAQPAASDEILAAEWQRTSVALGAFFLDQVEHIDRLVGAGYDLSEDTTRARLLAQPDRELADLGENVRTKLTAGTELHRLLVPEAR